MSNALPPLAIPVSSRRTTLPPHRRPFSMSSSPPPSSSPPRTPNSSRGHAYACIRSSPAFGVEIESREEDEYIDVVGNNWRGYHERDAKPSAQASLPGYKSLFVDGPHSVPSTRLDASKTLSQTMSQQHLRPSPQPALFTPGHIRQRNPSIFTESEDDEHELSMDDDDSFFASTDVRTTFFRVSAERGRWKFDPPPVRVTAYRQSAPARTIPTPPTLATRTISEPLSSTSRARTPPALARSMPAVPRMGEPEPSLDAHVHATEVPSPLISIGPLADSSDLPSLTSDTSEDDSGSGSGAGLLVNEDAHLHLHAHAHTHSSLPPSSPPLSSSLPTSPLMRMRSISPLSFAPSSPVLPPSSPLSFMDSLPMEPEPEEDIHMDIGMGMHDEKKDTLPDVDVQFSSNDVAADADVEVNTLFFDSSRKFAVAYVYPLPLLPLARFKFKPDLADVDAHPHPHDNHLRADAHVVHVNLNNHNANPDTQNSKTEQDPERMGSDIDRDASATCVTSLSAPLSEPRLSLDTVAEPCSSQSSASDDVDVPLLHAPMPVVQLQAPCEVIGIAPCGDAGDIVGIQRVESGDVVGVDDQVEVDGSALVRAAKEKVLVPEREVEALRTKDENGVVGEVKKRKKDASLDSRANGPARKKSKVHVQVVEGMEASGSTDVEKERKRKAKRRMEDEDGEDENQHHNPNSRPVPGPKKQKKSINRESSAESSSSSSSSSSSLQKRIPSARPEQSPSTSTSTSTSTLKSQSKPNHKPSPPSPRTNITEDPATQALDDELRGMLISSLALSRASSLPASALYKSALETRPSMGAERSEEEWMRLIRRVLEEGEMGSGGCGVFGKVESSFKDEAGRPLEAQWFYVPEKDQDQERAALVRSMMPRAGKRSETKKYKQYYYRPLAKISRWDPEDEL